MKEISATTPKGSRGRPAMEGYQTGLRGLTEL